MGRLSNAARRARIRKQKASVSILAQVAKRRNGEAPQHGIASLPGFDESLDLLLNKEQYALTDIALMFGVTRERMRQLAFARGWVVPENRGLNHIRVWDDKANRFIPKSRSLVTKETRKQAAEIRRIQKNQALIMRRKVIIQHIKDLARLIGRTPSISEIARDLSGGKTFGAQSGVYVCYLWGSQYEINHKQTTYKEVFRTIYHLAGLEPRKPGTPGHLRSRRHATHCYRGHEWTPENTYMYPNGRARACRTCMRTRWRRKS